MKNVTVKRHGKNIKSLFDNILHAAKFSREVKINSRAICQWTNGQASIDQ